MALMFPPIPEMAVSTRDLVGGGRLVQRELVTHESLGKSGAGRGLPTRQLAREVWEGWDRDSVSAFSLASPLSKTGPTIRSIDLKMPMIRAMSVIRPVMGDVTARTVARVVERERRSALRPEQLPGALVDHDPFVVDGVHDLHPAGPGLEVARPF